MIQSPIVMRVVMLMAMLMVMLMVMLMAMLMTTVAKAKMMPMLTMMNRLGNQRTLIRLAKSGT